ncbi:MAG: beta-ketoacyl-ACP reductase [Gammaproteobacteria bacterium]|nr:MAG: beta-ketoacyl-ACP reductase [Gammaproteobacteria bacterium]
MSDQPIAVVTGAGQGIGAAIVRKLGNSGCKVVMADINEQHLSELSSQLTEEGIENFPVTLDVTDKSAVEKTFADVIERFGSIDILVNNAGIIRDGFISKISEQDWDQVLDVNLKAAFLCCQAVFPIMKQNMAGKIVNIVSRAWLGNIGQANYSASKGGLVSLTRTLALEFARFQINVNAVAPGLIDTPMTQGMPEASRDRLLRMQPTGKMGSVDDIAAAVNFLSTKDSEFITGQIIHVDGGKSCGLLSL